MGNYEQLKQAVTAVVKSNGNQEITGNILQNTLLTIISTVGSGATFAGIATPTTNPGKPDQNVFYIASEDGIYSNFGNIVLENEVAIFTNGNGIWQKEKTRIATYKQISELENKLIPSIIEIIKPYNNWIRDKYNLGYCDANTGKFTENKSYLTSEKLTVKQGNVIQCGYFLAQGSYIQYNPNQFINIWSSDGFERINNSNFPSFPFQVTKDCEISYTWYNTKEPQKFEMNKQLGMLCISPTPPSSYEEYFEPYKKTTLEKEKVDIPYKQDNLIAGIGIEIKNNIISVIQDGNSIEDEKKSLICYPSVYKGIYELESRKNAENYPTIPNIENPKEILFVKNGSINQESVPLFCGHRIAIDQTSYVYSIDKTVNNTGIRGGILPMHFKFNGDAIEIGHRGLLSLNIIFKEDDNKWYLLSEKAIKIETQNGFKSYTIVKFQEAKGREFYVLNNSLLYSLRYEDTFILEYVNNTKELAIFAGSSITEASAGGEFTPMGWASVCAWMLGMECINLGVGQRGMVTDTSDRPSIAKAITDITYFTDAKYIFIGGAINDQYNKDYKGKVKTFITTLKSKMPNAIIVMLGEYTPQPDSNTPGNTHELRNQAVKEVALEENMPFIDMQNYESYNQLQTLIIKDTQWITGTFVSSSSDEMDKIGNCAILYNHENGIIDHTHPGILGHKYVGTRVANAMLEILKYI
jgi:hypothetical protein